MAVFDVSLSEVLDLTDPLLQSQLGLPSDLFNVQWQTAMAQGWEAITHAIGRAAFEEHLEGIMVPCAPMPTAWNLVVFRENLKSSLTIQSR